MRIESAQNPENMALEPAEQLTDGAYRDALERCVRPGSSKWTETFSGWSSFTPDNGIMSGARELWRVTYVAWFLNLIGVNSDRMVIMKIHLWQVYSSNTVERIDE